MILWYHKRKGDKKMLWNDMTVEEQIECWEGYCSEFVAEWGDNATPMSFDEFDEEWRGFYYYAY
jgi:hypothetical protein